MGIHWTAWVAWILLSVAALAPLCWMISGSFKLQEDALQMPPEWFPKHPTVQNYTKLFGAGSLWSGRRPALRWLVNSVLVATVVSFSAMATSALAWYALAKKRFRGRAFVFWAVVATMMLPRQVSLMPLYLLIVRLDWMDSCAALIAPYLCFPFGIVLVRQLMEHLPDEMIAAARIDGAGEWRIFWYIILPMARPALGAVAIFSFMGSWNEYLWQLIVTNRPEMFTLPVGVSKLVSTLTSFDLGLAMAGATLAFLPMLVVFVMFQRYFVKGISMGALKG